jgi:peptide/nickel transport system permease protein
MSSLPAAAPTRPASTALAPFQGAARWLAAHPYVAYAIRRLILFVVTLWGALTLAFLFFRMIPGDPIQSFIATLEQQQIYGVEASSEVVEHYRKVFGLEGNLFQQYLNYLNQLIVTRDLGPALLNFPTPAQVGIMRALPWTIGLLGLSVAFSWIVGTLTGALAGWRRNSPISQGLTNVAISLSHVPAYFVALMLVFWLAYRLAWFPPTAAYDPHFEKGFNLDFILSVIKHGTLPALSVVIIVTARDILSSRMLIVTTLGEDYLTFADAKGLAPRHILTQYALRNCWLPQVTSIAIQLGFIVTGNILVEQIFAYPGIGNLFVLAIRTLDFNTIQGIVAVLIFCVLTANLIIDLLLPVLDPRVKYWR